MSCSQDLGLTTSCEDSSFPREVRAEPENFSSFVRSTSVRRTSDISAN